MKRTSKKLLLFLSVLLFLPLFVTGAEAKEPPETRAVPRLVDDADILSDEEEKELLSELDRVSNKFEYDVVINTIDGEDYDTIEAYADDYFDYNGFGFTEKGKENGILLVLDMANREWALSTKGDGIPAFSDRRQKEMTDIFLPYMSEEEYYEGFKRYIDLCEIIIGDYESGSTTELSDYEVAKEGEHTFVPATNDGGKPAKKFKLSDLLIAAGVALVIAAIVVAVLAGQLKTVNPKTDASDYVRKGSFILDESRDFYLYSTVSKSKRSSSSSSGGGSSSHTSSSGSSHGGSHGSF